MFELSASPPASSPLGTRARVLLSAPSTGEETGAKRARAAAGHAVRAAAPAPAAKPRRKKAQKGKRAYNRAGRGAPGGAAAPSAAATRRRLTKAQRRAQELGPGHLKRFGRICRGARLIQAPPEACVAPEAAGKSAASYVCGKHDAVFVPTSAMFVVRGGFPKMKKSYHVDGYHHRAHDTIVVLHATPAMTQEQRLRYWADELFPHVPADERVRMFVPWGDLTPEERAYGAPADGSVPVPDDETGSAAVEQAGGILWRQCVRRKGNFKMCLCTSFAQGNRACTPCIKGVTHARGTAEGGSPQLSALADVPGMEALSLSSPPGQPPSPLSGDPHRAHTAADFDEFLGAHSAAGSGGPSVGALPLGRRAPAGGGSSVGSDPLSESTAEAPVKPDLSTLPEMFEFETLAGPGSPLAYAPGDEAGGDSGADTASTPPEGLADEGELPVLAYDSATAATAHAMVLKMLREHIDDDSLDSSSSDSSRRLSSAGSSAPSPTHLLAEPADAEDASAITELWREHFSASSQPVYRSTASQPGEVALSPAAVDVRAHGAMAARVASCELRGAATADAWTKVREPVSFLSDDDDDSSVSSGEDSLDEFDSYDTDRSELDDDVEETSCSSSAPAREGDDVSLLSLAYRATQRGLLPDAMAVAAVLDGPLLEAVLARLGRRGAGLLLVSGPRAIVAAVTACSENAAAAPAVAAALLEAGVDRLDVRGKPVVAVSVLGGADCPVYAALPELAD